MHYNAFIYSTCIGYFVFDREPLRLRQKLLFTSAKEATEVSSLLRQGKVTEEEKRLAKQHHAAILGFKEEKTDVPVIFDFTKYVAITGILETEVLPKLYEKNLLLSKQDIRHAVNRDIFVIQSTSA